jgi:hypothetical protein
MGVVKFESWSGKEWINVFDESMSGKVIEILGDALTTRKEKMLDISELVLTEHLLEEGLGKGECLIIPGLESVPFFGMTRRNRLKWDKHRFRLIKLRDSPIRTAFASWTGTSGAEVFDFCLSLVKEYDNIAVRDINISELKSWQSNANSGIPRARFEPRYYMARILMNAVEVNPQDCPYVKSIYPVIPKFFPLWRFEDIIVKKPSAQLGSPFNMKYQVACRDQQENLRIKELVYANSKRFWNRVKPYVDPSRINFADSMGPYLTQREERIIDEAVAKKGYINDGHCRNQSGGRFVCADPKTQANNEFLIAQPLNDHLKQLSWVYDGDLALKLKRVKLFLEGEPGTVIVKGDDCGIVLDDCYLMVDATSFDTSQIKKSQKIFLNAVFNALTQKRYFMRYYAAFRAAYVQPVRVHVGFVKLPEWSGIRSGTPSTTPYGTIDEAATLKSCFSRASTAVEFIDELARFGEYRLEKQWAFGKDKGGPPVMTLCQQIGYKGDNGAYQLHGILARMGYSLIEKEDPYSSMTHILERSDRYRELNRRADAEVVMKCANLWMDPKFEDFTSFVASKWFLKSGHSELIDVVKRMKWERKKESFAGALERKAISDTMAIFESIKPSSA